MSNTVDDNMRKLLSESGIFPAIYKFYGEEIADDKWNEFTEDIKQRLISTFDSHYKKEFLNIVGEDLVTGKRGTPGYTRQYIVDIRNYEKAELRKKIEERFGDG